jgi:hypothetical protein
LRANIAEDREFEPRRNFIHRGSFDLRRRLRGEWRSGRGRWWLRLELLHFLLKLLNALQQLLIGLVLA